MELNSNVKIKTNINDIFLEKRDRNEFVKICAPMVRYSKLEFRTLVRKFGVDLCYTPMIMADSFCHSNKCRMNEFTTDLDDTPLIAQFAAKNVVDLVSASEMIYPYVDGVDLNCGCPQRWAMKDGYGSALLSNPEIIKDMVLGIRRNFSSTFSVSIKMRLLQKSLSSTIELCRQLENCGIDFITVHGRTCQQKTGEPVNVDAITEIKKSVGIPIVANGDVMSLADAKKFHIKTNCNGIMSARGILSNPTLFSGQTDTPISCVQDWIDIAYKSDDNITFQCFHHHLTFMMEKIMHKSIRVSFNNLTNKQEVYDFLKLNYNIEPRTVYENINFKNNLVSCTYDDKNYHNYIITKKNLYQSDATNGHYFNAKVKVNDWDDCGLDFMDGGNIFDN